jgi:hypothetical protein
MTAFGGFKKIKDSMGKFANVFKNAVLPKKTTKPWVPRRHVSFPESSPAFKEYERSRKEGKPIIVENWGIQESGPDAMIRLSDWRESGPRPKFSGPIQPAWAKDT